jgi:hypothetical protein
VVCGYDESKQESFETANKGFITGVPWARFHWRI